MEDAETGKTVYVDTSSSKVREAHRRWWLQLEAKLDSDFRKSAVDYVSISTAQDFVAPLQALLARRKQA